MQTRRTFIKTAAALAGLGVVLPLAACSPGSGSSRTADGKLQIQYWHANPETRGGATVEALVSAFNERSDDIEVVARFNESYDGLMKNLQADAAAGTTPDVVQVSYSNIEYFPNTFSFTPADEVARLAGQGGFVQATFPENIVRLATDSEGRVVGFPYAVSDPILYANGDLLAQAGVEVPGTWQEVRDVSKAILEKTGKTPFYLEEEDTWGLQGFLNCNGGEMLTWDGKTATVALDSPENIEAMQLYADMVLKDKTAVHISNAEGLKAFTAGELAFFATTCANLAGIKSAAQFDLRTAPWPTFEGKPRRVPAGGCVLAVTSPDDERRRATMEFLSFLYEDENIVAWAEGTGYVSHTKSSLTSEGMERLLADDPLRKVSFDQLPGVIPWAAWPGSSAQEAQQFISDMRDQVLSGTKTPAEALKLADDKITSLL